MSTSDEPTSGSETDTTAPAGTAGPGTGPSQNQGDPLFAEATAGEESSVDHPEAGAGTAESATA